MNALKIITATAAVAGVVLATSGHAQAATPTFTATSSVSSNGSTVTATSTIKASTSTSAEYAGVCARDSRGGDVDFPLSQNVRITTTGTKIKASQTLTAGTYTYFPCVRVAGQWKNINSSKTFSVSAPATTPVVTPAPSTPPTTAPAPPVGSSSSWRLSFSDDFSGTSVNTTKWLPQRYGWGDPFDQPFNTSEGASFSPSNVTVSGGAAAFTVKQQPTTVWGKSYTHTSGMLSTQGRFYLKPGDYIEARLWIPKGDGLWPAFWTVPDAVWPPEIDAFEFFDTSVQSQPKFNYHWGTSSSHQQLGPRTYGATGVDYRESWHTYGLQRRLDGRIIPFVDGVAYTGSSAVSQDFLPQFVMLNLSMYAGSQPSSDRQMKVDYVRAWSPVS